MFYNKYFLSQQNWHWEIHDLKKTFIISGHSHNFMSKINTSHFCEIQKHNSTKVLILWQKYENCIKNHIFVNFEFYDKNIWGQKVIDDFVEAWTLGHKSLNLCKKK